MKHHELQRIQPGDIVYLVTTGKVIDPSGTIEIKARVLGIKAPGRDVRARGNMEVEILESVDKTHHPIGHRFTTNSRLWQTSYAQLNAHMSQHVSGWLRSIK